MRAELIDACGLCAYPLLALSTAAVAIAAAYASCILRTRTSVSGAPWRPALQPIAEMAFSTGLLGSVIGFLACFGAEGGRFDVSKISHGLATAFLTTAWGLVVGLFVAISCYALDTLSRHFEPEQNS